MAERWATPPQHCTVPAVCPADTEAVAALLDEHTRAGDTRVTFLDSETPHGLLAAAVAWPAPVPRLSDICTLFEHFGLAVQRPRELDHPEDGLLAVHLFKFATTQQCHRGRLVGVADAVAARTSDGFVIDDFASLILAAGITWPQVGCCCCGGRRAAYR